MGLKIRTREKKNWIENNLENWMKKLKSKPKFWSQDEIRNKKWILKNIKLDIKKSN